MLFLYLFISDKLFVVFMRREPLKKKYFEDLDIDFKDKIVFLDIDGTLAPDSHTNFSPAVLGQIKKIGANNTLYLCTNSRNRERNSLVEKILGVPTIASPYRKPNYRILEAVDTTRKNFTVIGDKFITDFLFAKNIGADFIKVKRLISGQEHFLIKCVYFFDDTACALYKLISFL